MTMTAKTLLEIDAIMQTIPEEWRARWCGGERGMCACLGCVQIGNRLIMVKQMTGQTYQGDPEYIDERSIPKAIYDKLKVSKEEWQLWMARALVTRAIELVLEDWPENHPEVSEWLAQARAFIGAT
jgi:hypothetical protein